MLFTSPFFLFLFLPIVLAINGLVQPKYSNAWLLFSSFVFYAWGGVQYAVLVLGLALINYLCALGMKAKGDLPQNKRKFYLILSIIINFSALGFFKYFNFFVENIEAVIHVFGNTGFLFHAPNIPLPIGISFFTFQIASYVFDVYLGDVKPQKSYLKVLLYVLLFPQLIAGPIVRYIDVEAQINNRSITMVRMAQGIERFMIGFVKKSIISNTAGRIANSIIDVPTFYSTPACWFGIICYAIQIYFDFSAYSDMAIGLGKMLEFDFLENFNYPYISSSIQEFWRRWHISLSTWFRDYVYIPLGGSRAGKLKTYRNLFIVFLLTGLWHGASWNFVLWGLWHGLFLILERIFLGKALKQIPVFFGHIYSLVIVLVGWVLFRIEDLPLALTYIKNMFVSNMSNWSYHTMSLDREAIIILIAGIVFSLPIYPKVQKYLTEKSSDNRIRFKVLNGIHTSGVFLLFGVAILYAVGSDFNPFIYFRF